MYFQLPLIMSFLAMQAMTQQLFRPFSIPLSNNPPVSTAVQPIALNKN